MGHLVSEPMGPSTGPGVVRGRVGGLIGRVGERTWPGEPAAERHRRATLVMSTVVIVVLSTFWVVLYASLGLWRAAAIPIAYQLLSIVCVVLCLRGVRWEVLLYFQLASMLILPFALQWTLGGFVAGSAVALWAIMSPISALVFAGPRWVMPWLVAFAALMVLSGLLQPALAEHAADLPSRAGVLLFVLNLGTPAAVAFLLLRSYATALRRERTKSDRLLYQMLPVAVAERLREHPGPVADLVPEVTVLFADLVGSTPLAMQVGPEEMIALLNRLFADFDHLAQLHGVEKITTLGDGYIAAAGVPSPRPDHAEAVAELGLGLLDAVASVATETGRNLQIRIGINTGGPVVAGVVGTTRYLYSIIGDAMNTASRMESHGVPGRIQVSASTYERLRERYAFEDRGLIEVKGKGPMHAYLLVGRVSEPIASA
jgi:class 3 adenylate cyclase